MGNIWVDGIFGFIVGDALGVPVEFSTREERKNDLVIDMREYGTHNQPIGTWSDDTSMTLATLDSIIKCGGVNYKDIMDKFTMWFMNGEYSPFNKVFDIGISTQRALIQFSKDVAPLNCGCTGERDNGNGSLMRILPVCLYFIEREKKICTSENEAIYDIHNVSALTHAHIRSQIACGIYYFLAKAIIQNEGTLINRLQKGIDSAFSYYRQDSNIHKELSYYNRFVDLNEFKENDEDKIKSSGYVVSTLEAVLWCLANSDSYKEAVLKAVNLGDDTDTVGAITGGLAGLYYGYESIPSEWVDVIQKKELIIELIQKI